MSERGERVGERRQVEPRRESREVEGRAVEGDDVGSALEGECDGREHGGLVEGLGEKVLAHSEGEVVERADADEEGEGVLATGEAGGLDVEEGCASELLGL